MRRPDIVAEAREWVGTPFHWQAARKGRGCDCKGLIWGVARELGLPEAEAVHARLANYDHVDVALLRAGLRSVFDKVTEMQPADVLLLKIRGKPRHLAIYVGGGRMIHTYGTGPTCVIEVPMGHVWRAAIDSIWTWRGIE